MEGLGGQLSLTRQQLEPSFSSLFWYGNTSSASYWCAPVLPSRLQKNHQP